MKAVLVAGTVSGVGKTTIATGLMGALRRRGYRVQPFKTGPDYIDPGYHTWATGETSRNLDTWMLPHNAVLELFDRSARGKDIAVIEGVMGLYDGRSATTGEGSTAELARLLGVPVLLVVDSRKGARSLAAMVTGYKAFDPEVHLAGVVLNGVGSASHLRLCRDAIEHYTGVPVVGHLPREQALSLPERHLGLIPTAERPASDAFLDNLVSRCHDTLDIERILSIASAAPLPPDTYTLFPPQSLPRRTRIAVARDAAFTFYYQDSLDLLEAWGAALVPFSPVSDTRIPEGVSGIYIGGGFPELYAEALAGNGAMVASIRQSARQGVPMYGECGGLMYLGQSIRDFHGNEYPMVGVLPVSSRIDAPRLSLGYRTVEALSDGPLLRRGETARGHEFHWSVPTAAGGMNAYRITEGARAEGFHSGNIFASYIHLHMASRPGMAQRFIETCARCAL